jgi:biopolymer transport protein ExbD
MNKLFLTLLYIFTVVTVCSSGELVKITIALPQEQVDYIGENQSEFIQKLISEKMSLEAINRYQTDKTIEKQQSEELFKAQLKDVNWTETPVAVEDKTAK